MTVESENQGIGCILRVPFTSSIPTAVRPLNTKIDELIEQKDLTQMEAGTYTAVLNERVVFRHGRVAFSSCERYSDLKHGND